MRQGALYTLKCLACKERGEESLYIGETARTPYDRGLEHGGALRRLKEDSPLVEHWVDHHKREGAPNFRMEV